MKKIIVIILIGFFTFLNVEATTNCSYKDQAALNKAAKKVKAGYEVVERKEHITPSISGEGLEPYDVVYYSFDVSIYNITEDFIVKVTNDYNNEEIIIGYDMTENGKYTFNIDDDENIIKYTINIQSIKDNCEGSLKSLTFTKPKYNIYSQYSICADYPGNTYCSKFITKDITITDDKIVETIEGIEQGNIILPGEEKKGFIDFIKDNYITILLITGGIAIIATTTIVIYKKRSEL